MAVPKIIALITPTVRDAYLNHADRLVHGYYELRGGKLHFQLSVEDALTHRTLETAQDDGQPGAAVNHAAKALAPAARSIPVNEAAIAAWGHGEYEQAVELDPALGLAWLSWVQTLAASGNQAGAVEVAQRAGFQPSLQSGGITSRLEKARMDLDLATLLQDDAARLDALRDLAALIPYDPSVSAQVAALEMIARDFKEAVKYYGMAAADDPSDFDTLNSLGYAEGLAGDLDAARKTFEQYSRGPGEDSVNALDSLGESLFMSGKFDEAESQFLKAFKKDPNFLHGETLWKAAHARWLAGGTPADPKQLAAADRIAEQFFELRAKAHDPLVVWRRATWLYQTGRREQAGKLLMQPATTPAAANLANQQLALWTGAAVPNLNLDALEKSYRRSDPVSDSLPRVFYAEALLEAGKKDQARELVKRWPLPLREDSPLESLVYTEFLELRKSLD